MLRIEFEQNLAANEQAGMWRGQGQGGAFCRIAGPWCGQMLVQRLSPFLFTEPHIPVENGDPTTWLKGAVRLTAA